MQVPDPTAVLPLDPARSVKRESTAPAPPAPHLSRGLGLGLVVVGVLGLAALVLAWVGQTRVRELEQELVRRQANSQSLAADAKGSAQQANEELRVLGAKLALAEAKLQEVALQRGQLEDLLQSFSRSRDENVLGDLESALRLAMQQSALVGNQEPLALALRQADERLQRHKQARLEGVRRAVLRDLDRLRAVSQVDAGTLSLRLDEVSRLVDDLPFLSEAFRQDAGLPAPGATSGKKPAPRSVAQRSTSADTADAESPGWWGLLREWVGVVWGEARGLLRITRIDHPQAVLLAPEQAYLLRENLKLRLLNARLALMGRQFDAASADLSATVSALERYADTRQRRTQIALESIRHVQEQAKPVPMLRPDDTLAALAAAAGTVR